MLAKLGYDPHANPPNYGQPDKLVLENEDRIQKNGAKWEKNMREVENQKKGIDKVLEQEKLKDSNKDPPSYNGPQDRKDTQRQRPPREYQRQPPAYDARRRPRGEQDYAGRYDRRNPRFDRRAAAGPYPALR